MIQVQILSGKQAGSEVVARRFPFCIGREAEADLQIDETGVWERHVQIDFQRGTGFVFLAGSQALLLINGERRENGRLRHGDMIDIGAVQLRFWLASAAQKSLRLRETLTWSALAALFCGQIALIYWLLT